MSDKEGPLMATVTLEYGALSLAVKKASAVAATDVIVAFVDEFNRGRKYDPFTGSGLAPQTGDAANKWLPQVVSSTANTASDGINAAQTGSYRIVLQPGSADTVNVASVQTVTVDPTALFIVATGTW